MARSLGLDALFATRDQEDADAQAEERREKTLASFRTPETNARIKAREVQGRAVASGEDPRITDYYAKVARLSDANLPAAYAQRKKDALQAEFIRQNPDLDPRNPQPAATPADEANKAVESGIQAMLRLSASKGPLSQRAAAKSYAQLAPYLTPELRAKYNLDQMESLGFFEEPKDNVGKKVGKKILDASTRVAATGVAIAEQGRIGLKQAVGKDLTEEEKVTKTYGGFKRDIDSRIGMGDVYKRALEGVADGPGKRVELFGADLGGQTDAQGQFKFDPTEGGKGFGNFTDFGKFKDRNWGLAAAQAIGVGGDVGLDAQNFLGGVGAAAKMKQAGRAALEAEGLGDIFLKINKAGGIEGLTKVEYDAAYAAIAKHLDESSKLAIKEGGSEAAAQSVVKGLEAQGQRGLRFGGRTVLPIPAKPSTQAAIKESARLSVADTVKAAEVGRGTVLKDAGDALVHQWDGGKRAIIQPKDRLTILRNGVEEIVDVDAMKVGDRLLGGDAVVTKVGRGDKYTIEIEKSIEEFKVIPKAEAARLAKEDSAAKARSLLAERKAAAATKYDRLGKINEIDDAIGAVRAADRATPSGGFAKQAEAQIPTTPGVHVVDDGFGGKVVGIRDDDGNLLGYLMASGDGYTISDRGLMEDGIAIFEGTDAGRAAARAAGPDARIGQQILDAAEEQGLNVRALLANSEFTDDGRKAAIKWLDNQKVKLGEKGSRAQQARAKLGDTRRTKSGVRKTVLAPDRAKYKPDFHPALSSAAEPRNYNVNVQTASGWQTGRRVWKMRNTRHMVNEGWNLIAPRVDSAGTIIDEADPIVLAKIVGWNDTPDGARLIIDPTVANNADLMAANIGDEIPEFAAVVTGKGGGQLQLRAMTQSEYDNIKAIGLPEGHPARAAEKAAAASDPLSAATVPNDASKAKVGGNAAEPELYSPGPEKVLRPQGVRDRLARGRVGVGRASLSGEKRALAAEALTPRANVAGAERIGAINAGDTATLRSVQAGERAAIGFSSTNMTRRMESVRLRLVKELGRKDAQTTLARAFDVEAGGAHVMAGRVADELEAAGKLKAANAVRTMIDLRTEISQIGMSFEDIARAVPASQMPVVMTKDGAKTLDKAPELAVSIFGVDHAIKSVPGFDIMRTLDGPAYLSIDSPEIAEHLRNLDDLPKAIRRGKNAEGEVIFELNTGARVADLEEAFNTLITANFRKKLGLGDTEKVKFFHDSPLTAWAVRSENSHRIAIEAETTMRLADEGLLHIVTTESGKAAAMGDGLKPVPGWRSPLGHAYAQPELIPELNRLSAVVRNAEQLKAFKKTVDTTTALWTKQVLSPITKGLAYPLRNGLSNTINATFGGLTVSGQREANRIQMNVIRKVGKVMREEGLSHDAALARIIGDDSRTAKIVQLLNEDDIMNTGLYRSLDQLDTFHDIETAGSTTLKGAAKRHLDPRSPDMLLFKPGRYINTIIEDNARIALYISVFDTTGSRVAAREAVAKYLFDYADLTPFESKVLKSVNAFWTFTRKNTALQLKVLADRPQMAMNTLRLKEQLFEDDDSVMYPGEKKEGLGAAGPFLQSLMGGKGTVQIDDPVTAAMQAMDPVVLMAYAGLGRLPGGDKFIENLPASEQPTGRNITRALLGNTAGAPAAVMTFIFEEATGTDAESGRPIPEGDAFKRMVSAILPLYGQKDNVQAVITPYGDDKVKMRTNLLRLLTGITFHRRDTDPAKKSLVVAMTMELEETIDMMKAAGIDVPTLQELRDAKLIPTLTEINAANPKPRTIQLTEAQKREAARKKITG